MFKIVCRSRNRVYDGVAKFLSRSNSDGEGDKSRWNRTSFYDLSLATQQKIHQVYKTRIPLRKMVPPVIIVRGEGVYLYDNLGNKYLDFTAGDSTAMLGHCHKKVAETISRHAHLLTHSTSSLQSVGLGVFTSYVSDLFGYDNVIALNSGNEAVETAIKLARKFGYFVKKIPENQAKIIIPENSYWGKSLAAMSTYKSKKISQHYGPHMPGFETVPFNNVKALEDKLKNPHVCGFLVEPIQAEAGVIIPDKCYLNEARRICNENHVLLMADEVHVGLGRCGGLTCSSLFSMIPDILIIGKALCSGFLPVSATLSNSAVINLVDPEVFGSTFAGFQLGCIVSIASLEALLEEKLINNSKNMGIILGQALEIALPKECVKCIRGKGLLYAVELNGVFADIVSWQLQYELMCHGLIVRTPLDGVIRLCPPLCIKENQVLHAVKILRTALLKLKKYCTLTWEEVEQSCIRHLEKRIQTIESGAAQDDSKKSSKRPQSHENAAPCEEEESAGRRDPDPCKKESPKKKSKMSQSSCCDRPPATSKLPKIQECSEAEWTEDFHNLSPIPKVNPMGRPLTSTKIKKPENKNFPDFSATEDNEQQQQQFATVQSFQNEKSCPDIHPSLQAILDLKKKFDESESGWEPPKTQSSSSPKKRKLDTKSSVPDDSCEPQKGQPSPKMKKSDSANSNNFDSYAEACRGSSVSDFSLPTDHRSGDDGCEPAKGEPTPSSKMKKSENKSAFTLESTNARNQRSPISDLPPSIGHWSDGPCEEPQPSKPQANKSQASKPQASKSQANKSQANKPQSNKSQPQQQSNDDELPGKSTHCVCETELFSDDPNADNYIPFNAIFESCQRQIWKTEKPWPRPTPIICGEKDEKSSAPRSEEAAKKDPSGDGKANKGDNCPKKPSEVHDSATSHEADPCPKKKDESFECAPVSKRTDRGKNIVTSAGPQPIPKKSSAAKKLYPDDGQVPSTSKATEPSNNPCKEGQSEKEKSGNSKNNNVVKKFCPDKGDTKNPKPKS